MNDLVRGPCPMMNTLANHGFLQRDGRNITRENAVNALREGLNFNPTLSNIMFDQAIIANPEPNATYFTLYVVPMLLAYPFLLNTLLGYLRLLVVVGIA